jgi:prepilin-type N-terminal cleavage/methylation domain-containing protein
VNLKLFNMANQRGFTLIELIVVIVILGILGAVAIPKFTDFTGAARLANIQTLAANIQTEATLLKSKWLVSGQPSSISLNGVSIPMSSTGYPSEQYWDMANWVEGLSYPFNYGPNGYNEENHPGANQTTIGWYQFGATGTCWVTYNSITGTATLNVSSC